MGVNKLVLTVEKSLFDIPWDEVVLEPGEYIIGRSPVSHIILSDKLVSRRHARIFYVNNEWYVEDLGSRNGTIVAGVNIAGRGFVRIPAVGARIIIGSTILQAKPVETEEGED